MNGTTHSPSCQGSPHFCICTITAKPLARATDLDTISAAGIHTIGSMSPEDAASLFNHPGTLIPIAESRRGRCEDHPYSWHYTDQGSCEEFEKLLTGGAGFSELSEHPDAMVALTAKVANQMREADKGVLKEVRAQRDTAQEQARFWRRIALVALGAITFALAVDLARWLA